ncbi:baseplate J/gp47 family protein [Marinobacterium rhizophilum]|uniref:Baseplate J/gp47 family protein n=1 Tax=Marinobacterium rhizophilum TaxID=420402 RepID=A0ABY5HK47_9GAMM|nr:baseplate J/gp47 family protein [Marinobacterium rhizophilum]UTW11331.1 baseplate J/gp47 family protein [Marinobacterium rhizophilum]
MNSDFNDHADLTRWNRAGLSHLDYVEGNAATYLEDLRNTLSLLFLGDAAIERWLGDPGNDLTLRAWQQRLLEQYRGPRRDYAWELLRSFARAVHVLAHTTSALANERYLRTATQWDSVRRLVAMLDYHPAPPASAETWLALFGRSDDAAIGEVEVGLAVQNAPTDGSAPLIFETLNNIDVDYRLNELRAPDFDRSMLQLGLGPATPLLTLQLDSVPPALGIGARALISAGDLGATVRLQNIGAGSVSVQYQDAAALGLDLPLADLRLHADPDWQQAPRLNGPGVVRTDRAASVGAGDVLAFVSDSFHISGRGTVNVFSVIRVLEVDGDRLRLSANVPAGKALYPTQAAGPQQDGGSRLIMPESLGYPQVWLDDDALSARTPTAQAVEDGPGTLYRYLSASLAPRAWYLATGTPACCDVIETQPAALRFSGDPGDLASGQWLLLQGTTGWYSRRLAGLEQDDEGFELQFDSLPAAERWYQGVGLWKLQLADRRYDRNETPLFEAPAPGSDLSSRLWLRLDDMPAALVPGRSLWIAGSDSGVRVRLQQVEADPAGGAALCLTVTPPQDPARFPKADSRVHGNLVLAGHGESKAPAVLGSGNRVLSSQEFLYAKTGIAFVRDSRYTSGVRAAVRVWADNREWTQVDNLRDCDATDTAFQQQLTGDGELLLRFGDGEHGQRLPSGSSNVRIQARIGNGLAGNLPAGSLSKLKKPHDLLAAVLQPAAATGGGELEATEALRDNAPASVLTLSRAVSARDFQALAERQSSVWHASARALQNLPGARERIELVVVPAGGGNLGDLASHLRRTLEQQACPGVSVQVRRYEGLLLELDILLRIDEAAYDPDEVAARVRDTLVAALSLEKARLGTPLYRSRLYQLVESVEGVENADCRLNPSGFFNDQDLPSAPGHLFTASDGSIRRISPHPGQLLYLNPALASPNIRTEAHHV